jgi:hypothetical protein
MQSELGIIILTKTKDNNPLLRLLGHGTNNLTQVSVPAEDG